MIIEPYHAWRWWVMVRVEKYWLGHYLPLKHPFNLEKLFCFSVLMRSVTDIVSYIPASIWAHITCVLLIEILLLCAGVLCPQPPEGDRVHTVNSTRRTGVDHWKDAQTGCKWLNSKQLYLKHNTLNQSASLYRNDEKGTVSYSILLNRKSAEGEYGLCRYQI